MLETHYALQAIEAFHKEHEADLEPGQKVGVYLADEGAQITNPLEFNESIAAEEHARMEARRAAMEDAPT